MFGKVSRAKDYACIEVEGSRDHDCYSLLETFCVDCAAYGLMGKEDYQPVRCLFAAGIQLRAQRGDHGWFSFCFFYRVMFTLTRAQR